MSKYSPFASAKQQNKSTGFVPEGGEQKEKEEPAAGAALHGLLHLQVISVPKNAAEIGYQQTRTNRPDSLEIAIASAEKGESTRFSCSSFCAVGIRRCSSSSRVDWTPFCMPLVAYKFLNETLENL